MAHGRFQNGGCHGFMISWKWQTQTSSCHSFTWHQKRLFLKSDSSLLPPLPLKDGILWGEKQKTNDRACVCSFSWSLICNPETSLGPQGDWHSGRRSSFWLLKLNSHELLSEVTRLIVWAACPSPHILPAPPPIPTHGQAKSTGIILQIPTMLSKGNAIIPGISG